jgi:hypothetical protein
LYPYIIGLTIEGATKMSLTNVINEWKAMPKTNLESDIGVLMDMIKTNSTLKVHTFYNEDTLYNGWDNDDFILLLHSRTNPRDKQYMYTTRANKVFPCHFCG